MSNIENNPIDKFVEGHTGINGKPAKFRFGITLKTGKHYASVSSHGYQQKQQVDNVDELTKALYDKLDKINAAKKKKKNNNNTSTPVEFDLMASLLKIVIGKLTSTQKTELAIEGNDQILLGNELQKLSA